MSFKKKHQQLFRQQTCPALITGNASIPFCIPPTARTGQVMDKLKTGNKDIMTQRFQLHNLHNSSKSLGSVNRDLYIIDQFEEGKESDGAPEGNFSSSSDANFPDGHVGRVWFALSYEESSEQLLLSLLKARNLKSTFSSSNKQLKESNKGESTPDARREPTSLKLKRKLFSKGKRSPTDSLLVKTIESENERTTSKTEDDIVTDTSPREMNSMVKIFLLPDERMLGQAKCKRKDADPIFVDRFIFQIKPSELKSRSLRMVFVEIDDKKRHHVIGHVTYALWNSSLKGEIVYEDISTGEPTRTQNVANKSGGDIQLSLSYNSDLSRLTVVLLRIKMCLPIGTKKCLETSVELKLDVCGKSPKTKKCRVSQNQRDKNGKFNLEHGGEFSLDESFRFSLDKEDIDRAALSVHARCKSDDDEIHTSVTIGNFMFARGKAIEQWEEMQNNPKEFVKAWQHLSVQDD